MIKLSQPKLRQMKKRLKPLRNRLIRILKKSIKLRHLRRPKPDFKLIRKQTKKPGLR